MHIANFKATMNILWLSNVDLINPLKTVPLQYSMNMNFESTQIFEKYNPLSVVFPTF